MVRIAVIVKVSDPILVCLRCLTGTPIINGLADGCKNVCSNGKQLLTCLLDGLLRFLRIRPWYDWAEFNPHIALIEKKQREPSYLTYRQLD